MVIDGRIDKVNVIHIQNGTLFSHKEKEILTFGTTWMDLMSIRLSETSQTEKDKYCMISLIHEIQRYQIHRHIDS